MCSFRAENDRSSPFPYLKFSPANASLSSLAIRVVLYERFHETERKLVFFGLCRMKQIERGSLDIFDMGKWVLYLLQVCEILNLVVLQSFFCFWYTLSKQSGRCLSFPQRIRSVMVEGYFYPCLEGFHALGGVSVAHKLGKIGS